MNASTPGILACPLLITLLVGAEGEVVVVRQHVLLETTWRLGTPSSEGAVFLLDTSPATLHVISPTLVVQKSALVLMPVSL